ncbi:PLP-dependent transferase [Olivibacter sp. SDN3]|nr:PLP-dependent transferase [Olivibacter sp. SDN3]
MGHFVCLNLLFYTLVYYKKKSHIETDLIHGGARFNETSSLVPPIYQTSTYYASESAEQYLETATAVSPSYFYHRHGNPVNNQAADLIAKWEGKSHGLLTSTGMAAISTAILSALNAGDHIIVQHSHYSATSLLFRQVLPKYGIEVSFVDQTDNQAFERALKSTTRLIYLESPSNPNLAISDLQFIAHLAKEHGILTICDNTFSSPINQRPHDFGIDVVIHSATKYLGGHSDLSAGVICASESFIAQAWKHMVVLGTSLAAFDAWLLLKGLRTLNLRVKQINENALKLAQWLEKQDKVDQVVYCGLPSHPQHDLVKRQMKGFTGIITITLTGSSAKEKFLFAQSVLTRLKLFSNAASLGSVESLIVHPASMWGNNHNAEEKVKAGIDEGMLRLSVGIENIVDLMADLHQALNT